MALVSASTGAYSLSWLLPHLPQGQEAGTHQLRAQGLDGMESVGMIMAQLQDHSSLVPGGRRCGQWLLDPQQKLLRGGQQGSGQDWVSSPNCWVWLWCFISAMEALTKTDDTKGLEVLVIFVSAMTYLTRTNLREEGLTLARSLKGDSHPGGESMTAGLCSWAPFTSSVLTEQEVGSSEEIDRLETLSCPPVTCDSTSSSEVPPPKVYTTVHDSAFR